MDENDNINVNLTIDEAVKKIEISDIGLTFSIKGKRIVEFSNEKKCVVLVGEKYFYRARNYASVTIILNNVGDYTNIGIITAGAKGDFLEFDFGAGKKFKKQIKEIFNGYIVA